MAFCLEKQRRSQLAKKAITQAIDKSNIDSTNNSTTQQHTSIDCNNIIDDTTSTELCFSPFSFCSLPFELVFTSVSCALPVCSIVVCFWFLASWTQKVTVKHRLDGWIFGLLFHEQCDLDDSIVFNVSSVTKSCCF